MKRRKDTGNIFQKYYKSFFHALDGIKYAIENEMNTLVMMIATIVTLILCFVLEVSITELCFVVICICSVMAMELVNSSIEACVDLETLKENELAKIAKDCASGASLMLSIMSLIIGGIIFIPKIIALF